MTISLVLPLDIIYRMMFCRAFQVHHGQYCRIYHMYVSPLFRMQQVIMVHPCRTCSVACLTIDVSLMPTDMLILYKIECGVYVGIPVFAQEKEMYAIIVFCIRCIGQTVDNFCKSG